MDPDSTPRDAAAVIDVAKQAAALQRVDPTVDNIVVVGLDGYGSILDLEELRKQPDRPRGTYNPTDVESFIDYVTVHKDDSATTIWVHPTEGKVLAILDDNAAAETAWREHKVDLTLQHSPEWEFWAKRDGELVDQESFAEHLREGLPDIAEPDGASLLEIATTFEAKTDVHFRSGIDLSSGEARFKYDEEIQATGQTKADGEVSVPRQFVLALSPFLGEEKVQVVANLRHRTTGGNLRLGYKLERPERAIEDALQRVADRLDDRFERVYRGTPAA
jgi:uncharacterized protein YfdQ (DUF2303 family)